VTERLYFRQLLSGKDFALGDPVATQMVNYVYLIGDRTTGAAVVIDPAYAISQLVDILDADGMHLVGALATHHHADHVGGSLMGLTIEGIGALLERQTVPVHVHRAEAESVRRATGVSAGDLVTHDSGDVLEVGAIPIEFLHTPGHTPGSQCFLVDGMLVSGDTLFLEGCGRTDLPGSNPEDMYRSLSRLAELPDDIGVYPGHHYSPASRGTLAAVKEINQVLRPRTQQQWLAMFGQ
jgi:glyoxylase-like metal-dependent hydrolase (beta-lactamase superfamily II)